MIPGLIWKWECYNPCPELKPLVIVENTYVSVDTTKWTIIVISFVLHVLGMETFIALFVIIKIHQFCPHSYLQSEKIRSKSFYLNTGEYNMHLIF